MYTFPHGRFLTGKEGGWPVQSGCTQGSAFPEAGVYLVLQTMAPPVNIAESAAE